YPILLALHVRLAGQVSGEQQARANPLLVQIAQQLDTLDTAPVAQSDREAEPGRIATRCGLRQDQLISAAGQTLAEPVEIAFARRDAVSQTVHLRQGAGGLHVGDLQVVAQMRVGVLVIIAFRQVAQLPAEAFAAGVVFAWCAVAVTPPVAEGFNDALEQWAVGEYRPAFAHGDVVRRVKTQGADITETTDLSTFVERAQRITAILDQPQAMAVAEVANDLEVEGIAQ